MYKQNSRIPDARFHKLLCYHTNQKLGEQSGKEETNKYFHQGFVDHNADDVGYTLMFYNKDGTDERRLLFISNIAMWIG